LMKSSTARILSSYEYMNYLLAVQVFVRIPGMRIEIRLGLCLLCPASLCGGG
jgi:hypothetical protein